MSKELDIILESCETRLDFLDRQRGYCRDKAELDLNSKQWWETYERFKAAHAAKLEQMGMHWTTSGDFSHLPAVGIGF